MEKRVIINIEVTVPEEVKNLDDKYVKQYLTQIKRLIQEAKEITKAFNNRLTEIG